MSATRPVAVVTGASSGIGAATARKLAADGHHVVLAARRESELRDLAATIEDEGGEATVHPTDVTDPGDREELVAATVEELGRIGVLVNNAGVLSTDPVSEADPDDWRRMVEVNLLGLMNLTRQALPHMLDREAGHVVMVSSVNARKSAPGGSGYCASKAGVNGFTESLRQEVAEDGIRVTAIEPGMVATDMQDEETKEELPMLDPEAIADAIGYAVSQPPGVSVSELLIRPTRQEF